MIQDRFYRTTKILESTWIVLHRDRELLLLTAISAVLVVLLVIMSVVPLFLEMQAENETGHESQLLNFLWSGWGILIAYMLFLTGYFIIVFFQTAVIGCALQRLQGGDPKFIDGIKISLENLKNIVLWAIISGTVGFGVYVISILVRTKLKSSFVVARGVQGILGLAWATITFFVVPILVVEKVSPFKAIPMSKEIFLESWGEQFFGSASIELFFWGLGLFSIPMILVGGWGGIGLAILYLIILRVGAATVGGIYRAAVYRYAKTGDVYAGFNPDLVQNAFQARGDFRGI